MKEKHENGRKEKKRCNRRAKNAFAVLPAPLTKTRCSDWTAAIAYQSRESGYQEDDRICQPYACKDLRTSSLDMSEIDPIDNIVSTTFRTSLKAWT